MLFTWKKSTNLSTDNSVFWKNNVLQDSLMERKRERLAKTPRKTKPYILKDNKDYSQTTLVSADEIQLIPSTTLGESQVLVNISLFYKILHCSVVLGLLIGK